MFSIKKMSYRAQIFIATSLVLALPVTIVGALMFNNVLRDMNDDYQDALSDVTVQISTNIDTIISSATALRSLPIINNDIYNALTSPYISNSQRHIDAYQFVTGSISQALMLDPNILQVIFVGRNGIVYDYGIVSNTSLDKTLENIVKWAPLAQQEDDKVYIAPVDFSDTETTYGKSVLPVVVSLWDIYNNQTIGTLYVGINFDTLVKTIDGSDTPPMHISLLDEDNNAFYYGSSSLNEQLIQLHSAAANVSAEETPQTIEINTAEYGYSACILENKRTDWKIVQYFDNDIIETAYSNNIAGVLVQLVVALIISLLLSFILSRGLTRNIDKLCKDIDDCESGDVDYIHTNYSSLNKELTKITDSYNMLNLRLMDSLKQNYNDKLIENRMAFMVLQSQINPHFLYNTLNTISSLANINNVPKISSVACAISDLLRYNLKAGPITTLKQELLQIDRYIIIQKARFPNKFSYECSITQELLEYEVPTFVLQPIIENAIIHGLNEKESGGTIDVASYCEEEAFHILISDNGVGMDEEQLQGLYKSFEVDFALDMLNSNIEKSIGILNVHKLIQSYSSKEYGISILSTRGYGTVVDIKLPYEMKNANNLT